MIADTAEEEEFAGDPFFKDQGIRFYAGSPLKADDGSVVGSVCVLDTRPRQITDKQREILISVTESVMMAIELSDPMAAEEEVSPT